MSDKQPLVGGPTQAPPPPYQQAPSAPPYPYSNPAPPPAQHYGASTHNTVIVTQARPCIERRVLVEVKPPNYVVLSIITMLFFCWVFGLVALIIGMQVDTAWLNGDHAGARAISARARMWNIMGIVFGVVAYVIIVITTVAVNASAA